jgi:hypothetical protein
MSTTSSAPAAAPTSSTSAPTTSAPSPATSSTPSTSGTEPKTPPSAEPASSGAPGGTSTQTPGQPSAADQAKAAAEAERRWKLKVNGAERELTEQELLRKASLGYSAEEKYQQAAEMRSAAEQLFQALKTDPLAVLTHPEVGVNFRELAEQYLAKEIQREMMPPEQRELEELREYKRQQLEAAQEAETQRMTATQQQEMQTLQTRAAKDYDTKITEVLKQSHLPKTPYTVKRVAELMSNAIRNGYELDVTHAVDMVREAYQTDLKALVGGLDGEALVKTLGNDLVSRLRKHDLAQIKAKIAPTPEAGSAPIAPPPAPTPKQSEPSLGLRPSEWLEMMRKKAGV